MATELTPLEDAAALIALQLTEHYLQSHGLGATAIVEAFNEIYWGVLGALNPEGWNSAECSPTKTVTDSGQTGNS